MKAKFIYEAFTDNESDPIHDMGIGGYSWKTIELGAVFKTRPERRSVTALTKNQSGQFTNARTGMQIRDHHYCLVTAVGNETSASLARLRRSHNLGQFTSNTRITCEVLPSNMFLTDAIKKVCITLFKYVSKYDT